MSTSATASSPSWTRNGSTRGHGAYCMRRPDSSGPNAAPVMNDAVLIYDARRRSWPGSSSTSAAVAAAVSVPVASPCTARAATSDAVPSAVMNTSALTTSSTSAGTMTRLRPTRSDARPTVTRATSTATAYAEKT